MGKKRLIEGKAPSDPKESEVGVLRGSLEVLRTEMSAIDKYLKENSLEDAVVKGDQAIRLRAQLIEMLNEYQDAYAEKIGLVEFYKRNMENKKRLRKGYEGGGGGAQRVFGGLGIEN